MGLLEKGGHKAIESGEKALVESTEQLKALTNRVAPRADLMKASG